MPTSERTEEAVEETSFGEEMPHLKKVILDAVALIRIAGVTRGEKGELYIRRSKVKG